MNQDERTATDPEATAASGEVRSPGAYPSGRLGSDFAGDTPPASVARTGEPGGSAPAGAVGGEPNVEGPLDLPQVRSYQITGTLGQGGMGTVWRAVQLGTRRPVALKLLGAGLFASAAARRRFEREVELHARLEHPYVARVYESGLDRGVYFYAMELVEGVPLDRYVAGQQLDRRQILRLMRLVCQGVQHAHQQGILHRDLKPSNILVTAGGEPKVLDFGLAKAVQGTDDAAGLEVSRAGEVAGTLPYMSPQQAGGKPVDTRTDVYSLGVVLYRLLTGKSPHELSGSDMEVMRRISESEVIRPRKADPKLDRELEALLLKALAKDPEQRYASAGELARDIGNYLSGEPISARPPTTAYFLRKRVAKYKGTVAAAAAVLTLLASGAVYARLRMDRDREHYIKDLQEEQRRTRVQEQVAIEQARLAERRLAEGLVAQGNALRIAGRLGEAKARYEEAYNALVELHLSPLAADLGLWEIYRLAPPVLVTFSPDQPAATGQGRPAAAGGVTGAGSLGYWADPRVASSTTAKAGRGAASFRPHAGKLNDACFSPDAQVAFSAGADGLVNVWQASTGRGLGTFLAHDGAVMTVVCAPNGRTLLSAGADGTVALWSPAGLVKRLKGPAGQVNCAAFSPDGLRVVSGGEDGTVRLWDAAGGKLLRTLGRRRSAVTGVAFVAGGTRVICGAYEDPDLLVWDAESGVEVRRFNDSRGRHRNFAVSADGRRFLVTSLDEVRVFDMTSGGAVATLGDHTSNAEGRRDTCFSPNGALVLVAHNDGEVKVWDIETARLVRTFVGHADFARSIAASADGRFAISASDDGTMKLWDLEPSRPVGFLSGHAALPRHIVFSQDGNLLLSVGDEGAWRVWDVHAGVPIGAYTSRTIAPFFQPQGPGVGPVFRWSEFSPDGRWSATPAPEDRRKVALWDRSTGRVVRTLEGHREWVMRLAFTPDSRRLVTSGGDGVLKIWDVESGRLIRTLTGHSAEVWNFRLSADGKYALSGSEDRTLRFWELDTGRELWALRGHTGPVADVDLSADGKFAVSAGNVENTVRAWDLESRLEVGRFQVHDRGVGAVALSPAARICASGSWDHSVGIWDFDWAGEYREWQPREAAARRALARDPDNAEALLTLGQWYAFRGVAGWAAGLLEQARARHADVSDLLLARCYWEAGLAGPAHAAFQRALDRKQAPETYLRLCLGATGGEAAPVPAVAPAAAPPAARPAAAGGAPFRGSPAPIPGAVLAADFNEGGEGTGYHDSNPDDTGSAGGRYRDSGVDIDFCDDDDAAGGGSYNVGGVKAGEWLAYTVLVARDATYDLHLRLASPAAGGRLHLEADGKRVSGPIDVPNTGGWQDWRTVTAPGIHLPGGRHVLCLVFDTPSSSGIGDLCNLEWIAVTPPGALPTPPAPPAASATGNGTQEAGGRAAREAASRIAALRAMAEQMSRGPDHAPDDARLLYQRAYILGRLGRFREAEAEFTRAAALDPSDHMALLTLAALRAYLGDETGYRAAAAQMLDRFEDSPDRDVDERVLKACLLLPGMAGAPERLGKLVERIRAPGASAGDLPWMQTAEGLFDLRAGNAVEAARALGPAQHLQTVITGRVTAELLYASALQQLGRADEADRTKRRAIQHFLRRVPRAGAEDIGSASGAIEDWLICQITMREARNTLPAPAAAPWPEQPEARAGPFRGKPAAVPGKLEAEDFDEGGEGVAYHDSDERDTGSARGMYRASAVDIDYCADEGGGYNVGGIKAGEWLAYTVDVAADGEYDAYVRVSSPGGGGRLHIEFGGKDVTGAVVVPDTGDWNAWQTVLAKRTVRLVKGRQVMVVAFDAPGNTGAAGENLCNLNWIGFFPHGTAPPQSGATTKPTAAGRRERLRAAIEAVNKRLAERPDDVAALAERSEFGAQAGDFDLAAADCARILAMDPTDPMRWYRLACLRLYLGDEAGYRKAAGGMLARFKDSEDRKIVDRTAKVCLLTARPVGDPAALAGLVDRALAPGDKDGMDVWFEFTKGILECRAGHFEQALPLLARSRDAFVQPLEKASAEAYMAECHYALNQPSQAQSLLAHALERVNDDVPKAGEEPGTSIEDWLIGQIAVREARGTVPAPAGAPWPALPATRPAGAVGPAGGQTTRPAAPPARP